MIHTIDLHCPFWQYFNKILNFAFKFVSNEV